MFKGLVLTSLLSFAASSSVPLDTVHTPVLKDSVNTVRLYGAYCMRDIFGDNRISLGDYDMYNWLTYDDDGWVDYARAFIYDGTDYSSSDYAVIHEFSFEVQNVTGDYVIDLWVTCGEVGTISETIDYEYDEGVADLPVLCRNLILWFPVPVSITLDSYAVFDNLFTSDGNHYNYFYTGYYSFNGTFNSNNQWEYCGFTLANNTIYSQVERYSDTLYCKGVGGDIYLYQNSNWYLETNYINIQGTIINATTYSHMLQDGVFSYVRDIRNDNATFYDLMFSIMDAPVHFITSLFNFELLGVQFYAAFLGILTVLLVAFVVRKVI